MDFAAILVLAASITGGIWLLDSLVLAPRRAKAAASLAPDQPVVGAPPWYAKWYARAVDFSRSFFPIILVVLLLRSFIVEPFRIPSGSMEPTLLPGDFILVNKFTYGLRLPVLNAKIFGSGEPQRGDVVVFRKPGDPLVAYIKRVVGLPGDRVDYRNKQVYINGQSATQQPVAPTGDNGPGGFYYEQRLETLGAVAHRIQLRKGGDLPQSYQVPPGHYFVMGDNRDNSQDSRFWGMLPEQNLIGKAFFIWMNLDCLTFNGHCSRIGSSIQ